MPCIRLLKLLSSRGHAQWLFFLGRWEAQQLHRLLCYGGGRCLIFEVGWRLLLLDLWLRRRLWLGLVRDAGITHWNNFLFTFIVHEHRLGAAFSRLGRDRHHLDLVSDALVEIDAVLWGSAWCDSAALRLRVQILDRQ